jgi:ParB family chromosome partitioning protein
MMSAKRNTIGRTFTQTKVRDDLDDNDFVQKFTLASGTKVLFKLERISAGNVATGTFVTQETNGRDQTALTPESLEDITRTIELQQFFPAIGRRVAQGIEILDGSRRRAGAIQKHVGLDVLVTNSELSVTDARQLAADIQTAKEHNLREVGLRLLILRENGMNQKEIAQSERLSEAKVTRAIHAASVPANMLSPFPVQSELTYPDYKLLLSLYEQLTEKNVNLDNVLSVVKQTKKEIPETLAVDEVKAAIMQSFRTAATSLLTQPDREKVVIKKLWEFEDKDKFARKKTKGRLLSYEFNRLPKGLQDELDLVIQATIDKHFHI